MIADIKLEKGDLQAERDRAILQMKEKQEELEKKILEMGELAVKEKGEMAKQLEEEKVQMQEQIRKAQEERD